MVAEPVAEPVSPVADSTPVEAIPSDERLGVTPAPVEVVDTGQEAEPEAEAVAPEPTGDELQAKYDSGEPLTTAEKAALGRHQQSIANQTWAQQEARRVRSENAQRIQQTRQQLPTTVLSAIDAELQAAAEEGRAPSPTLMRNAVEKELGAAFNAFEPVVLQPYDAFIRRDAYALLGADQKALAKLQDADGFVGAVNVWREALIEYGKTQSPEGQKFTKLKADYDKLNAAHQKVLAGNGKGSGASTSGKAATGGDYTYDQISKMTATQIDALPEGTLSKVVYGSS